jgi:hypothetical protein
VYPLAAGTYYVLDIQLNSTAGPGFGGMASGSATGSYDIEVTAVPEPPAALGLLAGAITLGLLHRVKRVRGGGLNEDQAPEPDPASGELGATLLACRGGTARVPFAALVTVYASSDL